MDESRSNLFLVLVVAVVALVGLTQQGAFTSFAGNAVRDKEICPQQNDAYAACKAQEGISHLQRCILERRALLDCTTQAKQTACQIGELRVSERCPDGRTKTRERCVDGQWVRYDTRACSQLPTLPYGGARHSFT